MFFTDVEKLIKEKGIGIKIVAGDFNETLEDKDRKSNKIGCNSTQPVANLLSLIKNHKLKDIWRILNENKTQFTWRRKDNSQASRIDYIFVQEDFLTFIESCKIKPVVIKSTDHQSVHLKFKSVICDKGRGYWKLNASVLNDERYVSLINGLIDKSFNHIDNIPPDKLNLFWDSFKIEVRETTIAYCVSKAKTCRENLRTLEKELEKKLECKEHHTNPDDLENLDNEISELENEISKIYEQKAKGAQIRSREKWFELGEKNNSYFLGLEKQRQVRKSINKLKAIMIELLSNKGRY